MLQRLEELLGQKLTSDTDATKLKKLSDEEMAKIEKAVRRSIITRYGCTHGRR